MVAPVNLFRHAKDARSFAAGARIFEQGHAADAMCAVKSGEVDIVVGDTLIETVGPGGIFGEMGLIDGSPRSAAAIARTDCELVLVGEKQFTFMVQETPTFALQLLRIMANRLRRTTARQQG